MRSKCYRDALLRLGFESITGLKRTLVQQMVKIHQLESFAVQGGSTPSIQRAMFIYVRMHSLLLTPFRLGLL
jgi:hypothetical protein